MNGLHVAASFALLVALAAPGLGQAYPQNRNCSPAAAPKTLPPADGIVNVAALTSAIAAEPALRPSADVTFSVRFLGNGQAEWVKPIGAASQEELMRLQSIVAAHTRAQTAAKEPWSVRLRITGGEPLGYEVSRSHVCRVEKAAANSGEIGTGIAMASIEDIRALQQMNEAHAVVEVGPTGQIRDVRLVRSSGSRIQDDLIMQAAREARYLPAVVDGFPVPGRYELRTRTRTRTRVN